ncbi:MAG TPA: response regulator transcription factor [Phycisphaerales bacterium]|nr:response regulator transcription factor [Phycisphaerales bacterium]
MNQRNDPPGIVMVDDNPLAAEAMERRFRSSKDLKWLGWTADSMAVIPMVVGQRPAVVLLDVEMPMVDSFLLLRNLRKECPATAVVMFSGHDQAAFIERALTEGASGYIHKDEPTATIAELVIRVAKGECVLSPLVSKTYMRAGDRPGSSAT